MVGSARGFYLGQLGTLLEVELDEAQKSPAGARTPSRFLVFYPYAVIDVGGAKLCSYTERREPPPAVGARVLVFALRTLPDRPSSVTYVDDDEIFFEAAGGRVSRPTGFKDLAREVDFEAVGATVSALASGKKEPGSVER